MAGEESTSPDETVDTPVESGPAARTGRLQTDEAVRLLADERRRTVLRHLMTDPDGTVSVDDLVDLVVASEPSSGGDRPQNRRRIELGLRCVHLPYLADIGVVEYETGTEHARYVAHPDLEALLRTVDRLYP